MWVIHSTYGRGQVLGRRNNGFELDVQFEGGKRLWVRSSQLTQDQPNPASPVLSAPLPALSTSDLLTMQKVRARRIIEALRLGIAPEDQIERLTFGRRAEINQMMDWLGATDEADQPIFLIEGEYGVGKTHLLTYMRHQALKINYAVASVQVDDNETPFYWPKRVYTALASSFAYPKANGGTGDFRNFITENQARIPKDYSQKPRFFASVLDNLNNEVLWDWILGKPAEDRGYSLPDYQNAGNVYSYLLSFLGWLAGKAGLRGLLLIFDEAESFDFSTWQRIQRGLSFIRTLALCARNDKRMLHSPSVLVEIFEDKGLYFGKRNSHIPPLYGTPSNLRLLMAFTDLDPIYKKIPSFERMPALTIESLSGSQVAQAVDEISRIYDEAYHFRLSDDERRALILLLEIGGNAHNIRYYIKQCIEFLDMVRHSRSKVEL